MPAFVRALFIKSSTNVELSYYRTKMSPEGLLQLSGDILCATPWYTQPAFYLITIRFGFFGLHQHPQTAYCKYAVLTGTIFENCDSIRLFTLHKIIYMV